MYETIQRWRASFAGFFLAAGLLCAPRTAAAQCAPTDLTCDTSPPTVGLTPGGGSFSTPSLAVTIAWTDNQALEAASRRITLNGADVTASFGYSGSALSAQSQGTITLAQGSNTLDAEICDQAGNCDSSGAVYVFSSDGRYAPVLSLAPHNGENRSSELCVADCFDAVVAHSTPAYVSLDQPRSLTLVYTSAQARPMGTVQVDATDNSTTPVDSAMALRLRRPDGSYVAFTNGTSEVFFRAGSGAHRLAAQWDASALATGAYDYTLEVRSVWRSGTSKTSTLPLRVLVVNESGSPLGWGWSLAGVQRIYAQANGSLVLTEGDGSVLWFGARPCSSCAYVRPNGDFSTLTFDGTTYTRRYPDGTRAVFASGGRLSYVRDRFGNQTTFNYDASNRPKTIQDPAGKTTTLNYNTSGKLSSVADPGGRTTSVTVNSSGDLRILQDPDGTPALDLTYDAQHRLKHRTDRRGGGWGFAYDVWGKLAADTLPQISADGVSTRPVVRFRSPELATLPASGAGTAGNPAARIVPSSVRAEVTNPRGHPTRYALDRFGAPTRVEEPLGRTTELLRNEHGQVTRLTRPSQGIVSFTWSGPNLTQFYDQVTGQIVDYEYELTFHQLRRVTGDTQLQRFFPNSSNGQLDSVRVGADSARYTHKFAYDSRGRVTQATDPRGVKTTYHYAGSGAMNTDSVRIGSSTFRRTAYGYDSHGRTISVTDPAGSVTSTQYDALNRVTRTIGAIRDTTTFAYDALYLIRVTDAKGQTYGFVPNALGWTESDTSAAGGPRRRYTYDVNRVDPVWWTPQFYGEKGVHRCRERDRRTRLSSGSRSSP